jgi:hypothetical protein
VETTDARRCPAPTAQIKLFSEIHSGHVNNDSGPGGDFIHFPPESLSTSSRNLYSHGSGIPYSHAPEYARDLVGSAIADYKAVLFRLFSSIMGQAGFQDWITAESVNDKLRLLDQRADENAITFMPCRPSNLHGRYLSLKSSEWAVLRPSGHGVQMSAGNAKLNLPIRIGRLSA